MKMNDQRRLEVLYEQVTDASFLLLDEEARYFDKISRILANLLVYKKVGLRNFSITFEGLKTLSNFDQMLWVENIPWFFDKNDVSEQEDAINETYQNMITYYTMENIKVHCDSETGPLLISFKDNSGNVVDTVDITDKRKVKEALKLALTRTLKKLYEDFDKIKSFEEQTMWYEWREKQVRYRHLTNRLPELEGMF
jgi:hypothetical protein